MKSHKEKTDTKIVKALQPFGKCLYLFELPRYNKLIYLFKYYNITEKQELLTKHVQEKQELLKT